MAVSLEQLARANQKSLDLLNAQVEELEKKKNGLPASEQVIALAAISDLQTQIRALEITQRSLGTSRIVVPFDDSEAAQLQRLEGVLGSFIRQNSTVHAMLASISPVMTAADQINTLILSHTMRA